jgi:aryl-alcohol dehydrogenase-like predicted oxidoreductase
MDAAARPSKFDRWTVVWQRWHQWLADRALTPLDGCLGFVLSHPEIARVVVGAESLPQFQQIVSSAQRGGDYPLPPDDLSVDDLDLINPSRWNSF